MGCSPPVSVRINSSVAVTSTGVRVRQNVPTTLATVAIGRTTTLLQHLRLLLGFAFPLRFGEGVHLRRGFDAFLTAQQSFDGEDLDFGKIFVVPDLGLVAARIGGFVAHGLGCAPENSPAIYGWAIFIGRAASLSHVGDVRVAPKIRSLFRHADRVQLLRHKH